VVRAIDIVQIALDTFGAPIYVRKEIVHNSYVVSDLAKKGAIFVNELDECRRARVIYSAHGVSPAVRERAKERKLKVIDATCPLVTKVHLEAIKFSKQGYSLVLWGIATRRGGGYAGRGADGDAGGVDGPGGGGVGGSRSQQGCISHTNDAIAG